MENNEYIEIIREIDDVASESVTSWEADFIESVLQQAHALSPKQRSVIERMQEKYLS